MFKLRVKSEIIYPSRKGHGFFLARGFGGLELDETDFFGA